MDIQNIAETKTHTHKEKSGKDIYPTMHIAYNNNPNKFLNFPIFGFVAKIILTIPQLFITIFIQIALLFGYTLNTFYTLFTGKYLPWVYNLVMFDIKLASKVKAYQLGIPMSIQDLMTCYLII